MITRVDEYLEEIIGAALKAEKAAVAFDSPPGAATAKAPTVNLLLFDVREELDRRSSSDEDVYKDNHRVGARPPTRYYRLRYLVTAQAANAREEHDLLGKLVERLPVPPFDRPSANGDGEVEPILVELALPAGPNGPSITDVWGSLGVPPRASLELHAITRVRATQDITGPPVEHLVLDVERLDTSGAVKPASTRIVRRWTSTKIDEHAPEGPDQ